MEGDIRIGKINCMEQGSLQFLTVGGFMSIVHAIIEPFVIVFVTVLELYYQSLWKLHSLCFLSTGPVARFSFHRHEGSQLSGSPSVTSHVTFLLIVALCHLALIS